MTPDPRPGLGTACSGCAVICHPAQLYGSAVGARPWPAHGAENAPMPCHLVERVRILVDGPISVCSGEGGSCMKGSM